MNEQQPNWGKATPKSPDTWISIGAEARESIKAKTTRWRTLAISAIGLATLVAAGFVAFENGAIGALFPQQAAAQENGPVAPLSETPFGKQAKQAGLTSCSTVFPYLGQILTGGSQYQAQSKWNDKNADKHAITAIAGMNYVSPNYTGPAAGIILASPTGTGCEGAAMRVVPFQKTCLDMVSSLPEGSKLADTLGSVSVYSLTGNAGQVLLLPSANTCVVISMMSAVK